MDIVLLSDSGGLVYFLKRLCYAKFTNFKKKEKDTDGDEGGLCQAVDLCSVFLRPTLGR